MSENEKTKKVAFQYSVTRKIANCVTVGTVADAGVTVVYLILVSLSKV